MPVFIPREAAELRTTGAQVVQPFLYNSSIPIRQRESVGIDPVVNEDFKLKDTGLIHSLLVELTVLVVEVHSVSGAKVDNFRRKIYCPDEVGFSRGVGTVDKGTAQKLQIPASDNVILHTPNTSIGDHRNASLLAKGSEVLHRKPDKHLLTPNGIVCDRFTTKSIFSPISGNNSSLLGTISHYTREKGQYQQTDLPVCCVLAAFLGAMDLPRPAARAGVTPNCDFWPVT